MDLYIVDSSTWLKKIPFDQYASLIWTERYSQYGDFTLVFQDVAPLNQQIIENVVLAIPDSLDVMIVESVESSPDTPGVLTATGPTLTGFLAQRIVRNSYNDAQNTWNPTGTSGQVAWTAVTSSCGPNNTLGVVIGNTYAPAETITGLAQGSSATDGASLSFALDEDNVYDTVKTICDLDSVGFNLRPSSFTDGFGQTRFNTYRGLNRTTSQTVNGIVLFEPALDSYTNIDSIRTISGFKNVAYAFPSNATSNTQIGFASQRGGSTARNWLRRSMVVDCDDIDVSKYSASALTALLNQRAASALVNNNYVRTSSGQIVPQNAQFKYGTHYNLGDIIELRDTSNVATQARVTEYIRSQDSTGETAYPTLSVIS